MLNYHLSELLLRYENAINFEDGRRYTKKSFTHDEAKLLLSKGVDVFNSDMFIITKIFKPSEELLKPVENLADAILNDIDCCRKFMIDAIDEGRDPSTFPGACLHGIKRRCKEVIRSKKIEERRKEIEEDGKDLS